jgi:hypothetical protein|tara:strand:+ start:544 stop:870 length:327 start_codon:yes stop_codon:yes gene_type:complete
LEDTDVTAKEKLTLKKDRFTELSAFLKKEGFAVELTCEEDFTSMSFITSNPDPIEVSIQLFNDYYRVCYWDGYGVAEFYDYASLSKAFKKFTKFLTKSKSNIEKFGLK